MFHTPTRNINSLGCGRRPLANAQAARQPTSRYSLHATRMPQTPFRRTPAVWYASSPSRPLNCSPARPKPPHPPSMHAALSYLLCLKLPSRRLASLAPCPSTFFSHLLQTPPLLGRGLTAAARTHPAARAPACWHPRRAGRGAPAPAPPSAARPALRTPASPPGPPAAPARSPAAAGCRAGS